MRVETPQKDQQVVQDQSVRMEKSWVISKYLN